MKFILPERVECANCASTLELDEKERRESSFVCPECGKYTEAVECANCGSALELNDQERRKNSFVCPECGHHSEKKARGDYLFPQPALFPCPVCTQKIEVQPRNPEQELACPKCSASLTTLLCSWEIPADIVSKKQVSQSGRALLSGLFGTAVLVVLFLVFKGDIGFEDIYSILIFTVGLLVSAVLFFFRGTGIVRENRKTTTYLFEDGIQSPITTISWFIGKEADWFSQKREEERLVEIELHDQDMRIKTQGESGGVVTIPVPNDSKKFVKKAVAHLQRKVRPFR